MTLRWALVGLALWAGLSAEAQITVPDRLPDGRRQPVLTTPAERGTLPFDTVRTLPGDHGGHDTWWHRHALFEDGPVRLALDPALEMAREWRHRPGLDGGETLQAGHRNVRGVRYAGRIDDVLRFGGTVLEMQRLLVGPDAEYVASTGRFPGMGPGKVRPAEGGLHSIDHSLAEVWFDAQPTQRLRVQWGLGATGMGPGVRNLLWHAGRAPAPYLLLEADLGHGWTYRWVQSRQRGLERLPANGAREGRYHPLGLGLRSLTKTWAFSNHSLHLSVVSARWTDALSRGTDRRGWQDWSAALAPWHVPSGDRPWFIGGHDGVDVQWRRPHSTWYGQFRINPDRLAGLSNALDLQKPRHQWLVGHVRHGQRWTLWTEWSPTEGSMMSGLDPNLPADLLGIQDASPWRTSWRQGVEVQLGGWRLASELGRLHDGSWSWKNTFSAPSASADAVSDTRRKWRAQQWPNRWWPSLVPVSPFISSTTLYGTNTQFWSLGISGPLFSRRQVF